MRWTRVDARRFLGAPEGILTAVAVLFLFLAIVSTGIECELCTSGRLPPPVDIAAGALFIGAGLLLRVRRPGNFLWLLFIVTGLGRLAELTTLRFGVEMLGASHLIRNVLLVAVPWHIGLTFPTGRPLPWTRWLIPNWYTWAIVTSWVRWQVGDLTQIVHENHPATLREGVLDPNGTWELILEILPNWGNVGMALSIIALITRWVRGSRAVRRAFAPIFALAPLILLDVVNDALIDVYHLQGLADVSAWSVQIGALALPAAAVLGIIGPRIWEGRISMLIRDLDTATTPGDIADAVARSLEDPTVRIAVRRRDTGGYADLTGDPVELPPPDRHTLVELDGETIGAILHARTSDEALMSSVATTVALALRRMHLQAEVQAQLADVRQSRERIVAATDAARRSIERNLHDGAQQSLVALAMNLDLARSSAEDPAMKTVLDSAAQQARDALEELRQLSHGMYPPALSADGLCVAIEGLIDASPIPVTVECPDDRFPSEVEATAYFVIAEALTNVAKHAKASTVDVRIRRHDRRLTIEVTDDGVGGARSAGGTGLQGIEDRVAARGGILTIHSPAEGGTSLLARIPLRPANEAGA